MAEVKVKVTSEADLKGLQETNRELDRMAAKAKISGMGLGDVANDIAKLRERAEQLGKTQAASLDEEDRSAKRLAGTITVVTFALRAMNFVIGAMRPLFAGVSSELDRLQRNLGDIAAQSKAGQFIFKPWQTILETINLTLETRTLPNLAAMADKVRPGVEALSEAKKIIDRLKADENRLSNAVKSGAGVYSDKDKAIQGQVANQVAVLEEQRKLELAKADREQDKVKRERLKAGIEIAFDSRIQTVERAGRSAQLKAIDQEIGLQNQTLAAAKAAVPDREELRGRLNVARDASARRQEAQRRNRRAFADVERLRMAESGLADLSADDIGILDQAGIFINNRDGQPVVIQTRIDELKKSATAVLKLSKSRLADAEKAERAAFGALPAGVGSEADIDNLIQGKLATVGTVRTQVEHRKWELAQQQDQIFKGDVQARTIGTLRQQTGAVSSQNDIATAQKEVDRANAKATHIASGFNHIAQSLGAHMNATLSFQDLMNRELDKANARIKQLESRAKRDPQ